MHILAEAYHEPRAYHESLGGKRGGRGGAGTECDPERERTTQAGESDCQLRLLIGRLWAENRLWQSNSARRRGPDAVAYLTSGVWVQPLSSKRSREGFSTVIR